MTTPYEALAEQIAQLREDLEAVAEGTAERLQILQETLDSFEEASPKCPPAVAWWDLSEPERDSEGNALAEWLDGFARVWFPSYLAPLPPCILAHPEALTELSNMKGELTRIYSPKKPILADSLVFFDRYFPAAIRRLADITKHCSDTYCEKEVARAGYLGMR